MKGKLTFRKISPFLLMLALVCTPMGGKAIAENLEIDHKQGRLGDQVTFIVSVNGAPNEVASLGSNINYNSEVLEYVSANFTGTLLESFTFKQVNNSSSDLCKLGALTSGDKIAGGATGFLVTLTFNVIGNQDCQLSLSELKDDIAGWTTKDGTFTFLTATFTAGTTLGPAPLTVHFTDESPGNVVAWEWHFGDGGTSGDQNPQHVYEAVGLYTVKLTARFEGDVSAIEEKTHYIKVTNPVAADFTGDPTVRVKPVTVTFTDKSAGDVESWLWDFGDGGTSTEQNPEHTYAETGKYTVTLTVTGEGGDSCTETKVDYIEACDPAGDIDGNKIVNLVDAILALKISGGINMQGVDKEADVNGDGKIGTEEAIYVMQKVSELR